MNKRVFRLKAKSQFRNVRSRPNEHSNSEYNFKYLGVDPCYREGRLSNLDGWSGSIIRLWPRKQLREPFGLATDVAFQVGKRYEIVTNINMTYIEFRNAYSVDFTSIDA